MRVQAYTVDVIDFQIFFSHVRTPATPLQCSKTPVVLFFTHALDLQKVGNCLPLRQILGRNLKD